MDMTRHLGPSIALSFFMVGVFAVLLYQPEKRPALAQNEPSSMPSDPTTAAPEPPSPTPGIPLAEAEQRPQPESREPDERPRITPTTARVDDSAIRPAAVHTVASSNVEAWPMTRSHAYTSERRPAGPVARPPARRAFVAHRRHAPFTQVAQGESLADIAIRVYGSTDAARAIWLANRDILTAEDAPLSSGMLLRTP